MMMRRIFTFLSTALVFFVLTMAVSYTIRTAKAQNPDRCEPCNITCFEIQERCFARQQPGVNCGDQYNACVVRCFREFCEQ